MLAAILPAKAQMPASRAPLPPVEYDHPYSGKLLVVKVSKRDLLQFLCTSDKVLGSEKMKSEKELEMERAARLKSGIK
jgi:hypothetical protein